MVPGAVWPGAEKRGVDSRQLSPDARSLNRQGEPVEDLAPLRDRLAHLAEVQETAPACPEDWGALRVQPRSAEFWTEAPDRTHERRLFERDGAGWRATLLSP